ncbi:MAG: hypothetical protein AAGA96_16415, partial [Verrucomicrobiota bacterium]
PAGAPGRWTVTYRDPSGRRDRDYLNLRAGTDTRHRVICKLWNGAEITEIDRHVEDADVVWIKCRVEGWMKERGSDTGNFLIQPVN